MGEHKRNPVAIQFEENPIPKSRFFSHKKKKKALPKGRYLVKNPGKCPLCGGPSYVCPVCGKKWAECKPCLDKIEEEAERWVNERERRRDLTTGPIRV